MVGFARAPILLVLLFGACVRSQAAPCGDLLCPAGFVCAKANTCVPDSLVTSCNGLAEGAACAPSGLGHGICRGGLCVINTCGDGIVNGIEEECDGTNLNGKTCVDFMSTDAAGLACASDCSFDKSGCNGYCGDGHKGSEEQCDRDDFGGLTCSDFSPPGRTSKFYPGGTATCTTLCLRNLSGCTGGYCGDGIKQPLVEDCDGTHFGDPPTTCASLGHPGATAPLECDPETCTFTESSCSCGEDGICPAETPRCDNTGGVYSCQ